MGKAFASGCETWPGRGNNCLQYSGARIGKTYKGFYCKLCRPQTCQRFLLSKLDIAIADFFIKMIGWIKRLSLILGAEEQT